MSDPFIPTRLGPLVRWLAVAALAFALSRVGLLLPLGDEAAHLAVAGYGGPLLAGLLLGRWGWTAVAVGAGLAAVGVPNGGIGAASAVAAAGWVGRRCPDQLPLTHLWQVRRLARLAAEAAAVRAVVTGGLALAVGLPAGHEDGVTAGTLELAFGLVFGSAAAAGAGRTPRPLVTLVPLVAAGGLLVAAHLLDPSRPLSALPAGVWWAGAVLTASAAFGLLLVAVDGLERRSEATLRDRLLADLKAVSADLIRRRAAMEALLDQLPVGVIFLDAGGQVLRQNRHYRDVLRLPTDFPELRPGQPTPSGRWQPLDPDGNAVPADDWSVYRAVRDGRASADRDARVQAADGIWLDVQVSSSPGADPDTGSRGAVFVVADLTARKQAERDRAAAEQRLQAGLDAAGMYAWEWDATADRVTILGRFAEVAGFTADTPPPASMADLVRLLHPDDRADRAALVADLVAGRRTEYEVEFRVRRPGGGHTWLSSRGRAVPGKPGRFAGVTLDISARKAAEERAAEADNRARFALAAARMCAWDWDLRDGRVSRSESIHAWLGLPADYPLGRREEFVARIHPDDRAWIDRDMPARIASGEDFEGDYRVQHADGSWRWVRTRGRATLDADGRPVRVAGVHLDITAETTAGERLRLLESAVVHARDAIVILDADPAVGVGRAVRYANAGFERMTGYATAEVVGRSLSFLGGPDSDPAALAGLRQALDAGRPHVAELLNYHRDGTPVWVELSLVPVPGPHGAVSHFVMIQRDVTDRKKVVQALRQSEERFRSMFESVAAGMSEVGPAGTFTAVNPAFAALLGRPADGIIGRSPADFTHPDDCAAQQPLLAEMRAGKRDHFRLTKRYLRPDGEAVWADLSVAALRDDSGAVRLVLGVSIDLTERKRLEQQLLQAQKMEAVGQLAGGIAHDFNNLLTGMMGHLGLVGLPPGHPGRDHLLTAEKAAQRAAELTQKLLGFARKSQLTLAPVPAAGCVAEVLDLVRPNLGKGVVLETDLGDQAAVLADQALLGQVVLNLCLNARDAMPTGGTLSVSTAAVEVSPAEAATHPHGRPGRFVRVTVADTGTGMTPAVLARIFEPFFTTKEVGKGTGLGLAMVDGIVRQHGGWVGVWSRPGEGTRFDLHLNPADDPLAVPAGLVRQSADLAQTPPPRPVRPAGPGTVLLVDDEEMIRLLGRSVLEGAGFTVLEAEDGSDAVALFRQRHADIDLVVLDLTMPRMSGREAYRQMAEVRPGARVLLSSGYSADDLSDVTGAVGLLAKPYRPSELVAAVRQALATAVS